jgi:hypothetical protein
MPRDISYLASGFEVPQLELFVWSPGASEDFLTDYIQRIAANVWPEYTPHLRNRDDGRGKMRYDLSLTA